MKSERHIIEVTRRWVSEFIVGLNLCPFAKPVVNEKRLRYAVCDTAEPNQLLIALGEELELLKKSSREALETTLLIHPNCLQDFSSYLDFISQANVILQRLGFEGVIQLVGFHPHYQFEGVAAEASENYTNRSPFPMIHLLREASVSEVASDPDRLLAIPPRNIATLNALGKSKILQILKRCHEAE